MQPDAIPDASDRSLAVAEQFAKYPFASDEEYQKGIAGIVESGVLEGKSEEEKSEILLRSAVFYFNRLTGSSLSMEDARRVRQPTGANSQGEISAIASASPASTSGNPEQQPEMLSFAQLKMLIEQGRTDEIPNNKIIPDALSSEAPSESKAPVPKKPWELKAAT
ncbi:hypothetical protein BV20DRAFT_949806 [Pilatotrama ljubarskyi]|nr:hypothetical protein BV20DRAFT_949806 [Pilatotrama ljubarskyi]